MSAIIKRELYAYFNSAVGYVVLGVFYFFSGLFFYHLCLNTDSASMTYVFLSMLTIIVLVIPIITMRSFADERKQKTDQALLTSPVSLTEIVIGKFIGAFLLYCLCNAVFLIDMFIISYFTKPDWALFWSTMLGLLLLGGALIAVDLLISAMTESQVIAAVFSIGFGLLISMLDSLSGYIRLGDLVSGLLGVFRIKLSAKSTNRITEWFAAVMHNISFDAHFTNFINGLINITSVVFFLSVIAVFLFLCVRVFEKRRWS